MNPTQVTQLEKTAASTESIESSIGTWVKANCKG